MLILISPAKSLNLEPARKTIPHTQPELLDAATPLVNALREYSPARIAGLMDISDTLATLNVTRFAEWSRPFSLANAKQAVLAFDGDVYGGLDAPSLTKRQLDFAQKHLRILSGLYGLLRPLDLMQAYRLEMGTRLANPAGRDLYAYWGNRITDAVNAAMREAGADTLVNLASEEYFKSVKPKFIEGRIIQPVFEDWKTDRYKIISFHAKRARGLMSRYAIDHRIRTAEKLRNFDSEGYAFCADASNDTQWIFRRKLAQA